LARKRQKAKRDSRVTRQRILAAATQEFASKGLEGARVDEIARRAGANKNMIYHYYDSKDGLFQAVLEEMYGTIRAHQTDTRLSNLSPADGMRLLVGSMFDVFCKFPAFVSLLQSENLAKARHVRRSSKIAALYNPFAVTLGGLLRRGSREGVFRASIDPIDLYVSIASLAAYHISNRYTLSALFGADIGTPRAVRRRRGHIVDVILRYIMREPELAGVIA
jgi:TetR/AcrR family transcriptional regulator